MILKSDINLKVTGKTLYKNITESEDLNPLLNLIEEEDNTLISNKKQGIISIILNIITLTLIVIFSFLYLESFMSNSFGKIFRISTFGESHGKAIESLSMAAHQV